MAPKCWRFSDTKISRSLSYCQMFEKLSPSASENPLGSFPEFSYFVQEVPMMPKGIGLSNEQNLSLWVETTRRGNQWAAPMMLKCEAFGHQKKNYIPKMQPASHPLPGLCHQLCQHVVRLSRRLLQHLGERLLVEHLRGVPSSRRGLSVRSSRGLRRLSQLQNGQF